MAAGELAAMVSCCCGLPARSMKNRWILLLVRPAAYSIPPCQARPCSDGLSATVTEGASTPVIRSNTLITVAALVTYRRLPSADTRTPRQLPLPRLPLGMAVPAPSNVNRDTHPTKLAANSSPVVGLKVRPCTPDSPLPVMVPVMVKLRLLPVVPEPDDAARGAVGRVVAVAVGHEHLPRRRPVGQPGGVGQHGRRDPGRLDQRRPAAGGGVLPDASPVGPIAVLRPGRALGHQQGEGRAGGVGPAVAPAVTRVTGRDVGRHLARRGVRGRSVRAGGVPGVRACPCRCRRRLPAFPPLPARPGPIET